MATLLERKTALEDALFQGSQIVRFSDGASVTYRSVAEISSALALVNAEIAGAAGPPRPRRLILCPTTGVGI